MNGNDRQITWDRYTSAWKAVDAKEKAAALATSVAPTCVYTDPLVQVDGHEALVDYMLGFHQQMPGAWFETTWFLSHHDRSIARWNMRSGEGTVVGEGISYGVYDEQGMLVAMTGFFEVQQAGAA